MYYLGQFNGISSSNYKYSYSDYVVLNDWLTNEFGIGKDMEGSGLWSSLRYYFGIYTEGLREHENPQSA
jgi:hypothetical protein